MTILNKTLLACVLMSAGGLAHAENVEDLSGWKSDGDGAWVYNADTNIWDQNVNTAAGSFLYQPSGDALGKAVSGTITVNTTIDDDWVGFALGYNAGDNQNVNADYFLLTWKQTPQSQQNEGLSLWHVKGAINSANLWGLNSSNILTKIRTAATLSDVGWEDNTAYNFDLTYEKSAMGIFIGDSLEFALTAGDVGLTSYNPGGFAFFNFSQQNVSYGGLTFGDINNVINIEKQEALATEVPLMGSTAALAVAGLLGFRRRK